MDNISKFFKAVNTLKSNVGLSFFGEITWTAVKAEMDKL